MATLLMQPPSTVLEELSPSQLSRRRIIFPILHSQDDVIAFQNFGWENFPLFDGDSEPLKAGKGQKEYVLHDEDKPTIPVSCPDVWPSSRLRRRRASAPNVRSLSKAKITTRLAAASRSHSQIRKQSNTKNTVRFSPILKIHSLPVILGQHPCCKDGMALTFDWVDDNSSRDAAGQIVDLEYYEKKSLKRHPNELRLNYDARLHRLQNAMGMTEMELKLMEHIIVNEMKL